MVLKRSTLEGLVSMFLDTFKGKRILITGHTGFKGSWLSFILHEAGANVFGYALKPEPESLYNLLELDHKITSIYGDVRDKVLLWQAFDSFQPEIAIHMAAQSLVIPSYLNPVETYETNILGTLYFLDCVNRSTSIKSSLIITTDKVYQNDERQEPYVECDRLNGYDPYSNSKSCADLIAQTYQLILIKDEHKKISIARAGNVIGGGDFADHRIIPDIIRSIMQKKSLILRNPHAIRPYQHVLEPLFAYLWIIEKQNQDRLNQGIYNIAPHENDIVSTDDIIKRFEHYLDIKIDSFNENKNIFHEAKILRLDASHIKDKLGFEPLLHIDQAIEWTAKWYRVMMDHGDLLALSKEQIALYSDLFDQKHVRTSR